MERLKAVNKKQHNTFFEAHTQTQAHHGGPSFSYVEGTYDVFAVFAERLPSKVQIVRASLNKIRITSVGKCSVVTASPTLTKVCCCKDCLFVVLLY